MEQVSERNLVNKRPHCFLCKITSQIKYRLSIQKIWYKLSKSCGPGKQDAQRLNDNSYESTCEWSHKAGQNKDKILDGKLKWKKYPRKHRKVGQSGTDM